MAAIRFLLASSNKRITNKIELLVRCGPPVAGGSHFGRASAAFFAFDFLRERASDRMDGRAIYIEQTHLAALMLT